MSGAGHRQVLAEASAVVHHVKEQAELNWNYQATYHPTIIYGQGLWVETRRTKIMDTRIQKEVPPQISGPST